MNSNQIQKNEKDRICLQCGKKYRVRSKSQIARSKYCSNQCKVDSTKKEKIILKCCECGKEILIHACLSKQKYCSAQCMGIGRRKIRDSSIRQCSQCKEIQPSDCFQKKKRGFDSICKKCRNKRTWNRFRTIKGQFCYSKSRAKQRHIDWQLTEEEYAGLRQQICHYCHGLLNETSVGLDRKDNNKGYVLDNVVPCCCDCNRTRGDHYTYEEMLRLAVLIREIKRDRIK